MSFVHNDLLPFFCRRRAQTGTDVTFSLSSRQRKNGSKKKIFSCSSIIMQIFYKACDKLLKHSPHYSLMITGDNADSNIIFKGIDQELYVSHRAHGEH